MLDKNEKLNKFKRSIIYLEIIISNVSPKKNQNNHTISFSVWNADFFF